MPIVSGTVALLVVICLTVDLQIECMTEKSTPFPCNSAFHTDGHAVYATERLNPV